MDFKTKTSLTRYKTTFTELKLKCKKLQDQQSKNFNLDKKYVKVDDITFHENVKKLENFLDMNIYDEIHFENRAFKI